MTEAPEQLTLPLEFHMYDHYTIEVRKGAVGEMQTLRTMSAKSVEDAQNLIEGFRDSCLQREDVTWQADEVDAHGNLYGLVSGVVWQISVVPPLTEPLVTA